MKNCPGCSKEIDQHAIACQYCGRVVEERKKKNKKNSFGKDLPNDKKSNNWLKI